MSEASGNNLLTQTKRVFCRQDLHRYFAFQALKLCYSYMQTEVKGEFDGDYFQQQINPHLVRLVFSNSAMVRVGIRPK